MYAPVRIGAVGSGGSEVLRQLCPGLHSLESKAQVSSSRLKYETNCLPKAGDLPRRLQD